MTKYHRQAAEGQLERDFLGRNTTTIQQPLLQSDLTSAEKYLVHCTYVQLRIVHVHCALCTCALHKWLVGDQNNSNMAPF